MDLFDVIDDLNALKEAYRSACKELAWCCNKLTGDTSSGKYYEKLFFERAKEKEEVKNNDQDK